jgi:hypothetical protein
MTRNEDANGMRGTQNVNESDSRPEYFQAIIESIDELSSELRRISLEIHGRPPFAQLEVVMAASPNCKNNTWSSINPACLQIIPSSNTKNSSMTISSTFVFDTQAKLTHINT